MITFSHFKVAAPDICLHNQINENDLFCSQLNPTWANAAVRVGRAAGQYGLDERTVQHRVVCVPAGDDKAESTFKVLVEPHKFHAPLFAWGSPGDGARDAGRKF